MTARLEADHRQGRTQVTQLGNGTTIEPAGPVVSRMPQPRLAGTTAAAFLPLHKDLQGRFTAADKAIAYPSAKTAAVRHQVQGFQHAGLAGAVVAGDEIETGPRSQAHLRKAPQPREIHWHRALAVLDMDFHAAETGGTLVRDAGMGVSRRSVRSDRSVRALG